MRYLLAFLLLAGCSTVTGTTGDQLNPIIEYSAQPDELDPCVDFPETVPPSTAYVQGSVFVTTGDWFQMSIDDVKYGSSTPPINTGTTIWGDSPLGWYHYEVEYLDSPTGGKWSLVRDMCY